MMNKKKQQKNEFIRNSFIFQKPLKYSTFFFFFATVEKFSISLLMNMLSQFSLKTQFIDFLV